MTTATDTDFELTFKGSRLTIERPNGAKASRAIALLRALSKAQPEVARSIATFRADYERDNVLELDRAAARRAFPARPLIDGDGRPVFDDDDELIMVPSFVDGITDADWAESGQRLRIPRSPSDMETVAAVFDKAVELAEEHVYRILALFTLTNAEVSRSWRDGSLQELTQQRVDELLEDLYVDELLELAVLVAEALDEHIIARTRRMAQGGRLGNLLRLIGREPASRSSSSENGSTPTSSSDGLEPSTPTSSTDSPEPTAAGQEAPSSTSPGTSSPTSSTASSATPSELERSAPTA